MAYLEELMLIYANKDIINEALTAAGGEPMKDEWYWSSSEKSDYGAWSQHFNDGSIASNTNKGYYSYVRPVLSL